MVMPYQKTERDECLEEVFKTGAENIGLDGIPDDPTMRGILELSEYVEDYTLSALIIGLGIEPGSDEAKKYLGAFIDGKLKLNPRKFKSSMNRGKERTIR